MFLNSGKCFGFWDVSSGGLWNVFWILASIFEFKKVFGFWDVFWIWERVLSPDQPKEI